MKFALPAEIDTLERSQAGAAFPIISLRTGQPIVIDKEPLTISAKGSDSEAYEEAVRAADRKALKLKEEGREYSIQERMSDILAAVTTSWTSIKDDKGVAAPCTPDNARVLYMGAPEIRDQMFGRVTQRANFIKASSNA